MSAKTLVVNFCHEEVVFTWDSPPAYMFLKNTNNYLDHCEMESIYIWSWHEFYKKRLIDAITLYPDIFIWPDLFFFVVEGTVSLVQISSAFPWSEHCLSNDLFPFSSLVSTHSNFISFQRLEHSFYLDGYLHYYQKIEIRQVILSDCLY